MKLVATLIALTMMSGFTALHAQSNKVGFFQCDTAECVLIEKGKTFVLDNCDWALVANPLFVQRLVGLDIKKSEAINVLQERIKLGDLIAGMQDSVIDRLKRIDTIQSNSYAILHDHFEKADGLVQRATANTDAALDYIKRVKLTSYVTSGLLGGITGGVVMGQVLVDNNDRSGFTFSWPGAVGGVVVGCLVNGLFMHWLN